MALRRAPHLFSTSLALAAAALAPWHARADSGLFATTWSQEAIEGVGVSLESPELRALRMYEEELFGPGPTLAPEPYDPDCVYGAPDALSSDVPPPRVERAGESVDLSFLSELRMPGLPVRWDSRVIDYLLFFKNDRRGHDLMAAWLKRMERHGPLIRRVLAEHSLPQDLQFVAMVESGYDLTARSHANAQGMWQFVKASGQHYGLRVDHWVDERLDPEASTRAAARYMRDLYDRFESWELAFAAYNMGYGGLLRSVRKYNTNDYWLLSHLEAGLPYETALYVAKITAVAIIANNPERFGFDDLSYELPMSLAKVQVPAGTALRPVAQAARVDLELLKAVNPHLRRGRVPPGDEPVNVYVPKESYEQFAKSWSKNREPAQHVSYVVRFGETLEDVARRSNLSPARLRSLNELPDDVPVGAGFPLIVPATHEVKTLNGEQPVATVPARDFQVEGRRRVFYQVARQDTLLAIARFFDVTVEELRAWNHLAEGAALQRGMLLQLFVRPDLDLGQAVVFAPDEVRVLTLGSDEFFDFHEGQRGRVRVRYRVQPGDTVAKIGERFELSAASVGRINQFPSGKTLAPDDWVVVYVPEDQIPGLEKKGLIARYVPDAGAIPVDVATEPATETSKEPSPKAAESSASLETAAKAEAEPEAEPSEDDATLDKEESPLTDDESEPLDEGLNEPDDGDVTGASTGDTDAP
jgi:membrane-bound lytic murein transglycosylase D